MALSKPVSCDGDEDLDDFFIMFAAQRTALHAKQMEVLRVLQDIEVLEQERENAETQCRQLVATAVRLCSRERHVWSHPRAQSWYEETLPHFPESVFRENFRLNRCTFRYIVSVCKSMVRQDTNMRRAIPLEKRVAIGLYRLATSAEDRTVANLFGVSRSSVNIIFREFCSVVVRRLEPRYVRFPSAQGLAEHLRQFTAVAGFPQGIGALDGCHIEVCPPKEHAADYFNYKGWYSTILLAVVDHQYRFMYTNVGSPGRIHDAAVFERSRLPTVLSSNLFRLNGKLIEGVSVGPVLLADQAFPLQPHLMKPFPRPGPIGSVSHVFNYNLSSARRIVENAFGRLKARFRIMHKGLECDIDNVNCIIRACCVLNNICEQLTDHCDASWIEVARSEDARRAQPVCTSSRNEPLGVEVREALAKHIAARRAT